MSDHYLGMTESEQKDFDERYFDSSQVLTHRWNPLGYISRSKSRRVGDIADIVEILFPDGGGDNAIWNSMASGVFSAYVLYMLDMEKIVKDINEEIKSNKEKGVEDDREELPPYPVTMAQMFTLTGVGDIAEWMNEEILYWKEKGRPLSHETVEGFNRFTSVDVKTRGNIMQNFNQPLKVYQVESCMLATSANDFDFGDLRKKRTSIYIVLTPSGIKKYGRLINLFFSQLVNVNTKELPEHNSDLKYQCLLVLDEFTSMGRVEIIEKSIAFTAGYDLRYMLIYQDDGQLESDEAYGKSGARVLKKNLALEVVYPPKVVDETADRVSKTFGKKTVKITNKSRTSSLGGGVSNGESEQYVGRDLYLPQEVVELGSVKYFSEVIKKNIFGMKVKKKKRTNLGINEIIIMEQVKPFVAHKIMYFDEPIFQKRKKISQDNIPDIPVLKVIERFELPREKRHDIPQIA
jgi:type IV secretion system protein VirD4